MKLYRIQSFVNSISRIQLWLVGSTPRLFNEAMHALLVSSQFWRKNLQGDGTMKLAVVSEIDLSHAAGAKLRTDFIATKFCT